MPQLDIVTYLGQIFWFLTFFTIFYLLVVSYILPSLAFIMKVRQKRLNNIGTLSTTFIDEKVKVTNHYDILLSKSAATSVNLLGKSKTSSSKWVSDSAIAIMKNNANSFFLNTFSELQSKKIILKTFVN